jgi:putative SOS response-associated peptidase YedK
MCFYFRASKQVLEKMETTRGTIDEAARSLTTEQFNGFEHPFTPVVTHVEPDRVQLLNWGLIPTWAKDRNIQRSTLNAKIETLSEKPSFKYLLGNRCLIYADGFYEWHWLDPKGKQKQKYVITLDDEQPFCFAGLWNNWKDPLTGMYLKTYTLITRPANELMARVHNSKQRMPWILPQGLEADYLSGKPIFDTAENLKASLLSD